MTRSRFPLWFRVGLSLALYVGLTFLVTGTLLLLRGEFPESSGAPYDARTLALFLGVGAGTGVLTVLLLTRGFRHPAWDSLVGAGPGRFEGPVRRVGAGVLGGAALATLLSLGLLAGGGAWGGVAASSEPGGASLLVAVLPVAAFSEELFFRGYLHRILRERLGVLPSATVGGALFSLVHLLNPGASPLAALNVLAAGMLLALLRESSGSLWGPVGWHAGWNLALGMVYGLPVSGVDLPSVFRLEVTGLTTPMGGGVFGPEGSLPCAVLLLALLLVWGWRRRAGGRHDAEETQ